MGVEQADGLNPELKPSLNDINSPKEEQINNNQSSSLDTANQTTTTTQYYYDRNETHLIEKKTEEKENIKEEPDSMTIVGNRIIKVGQPAIVYEKRVISKTIKKDNNNNININTNNVINYKEEKIEKEPKKVEILKNEIIKKEIITNNITTTNIKSIKKEIIANNITINNVNNNNSTTTTTTTTKIINDNSSNSNTIKKEIIDIDINNTNNNNNNVTNIVNSIIKEDKINPIHINNINNSIKKRNILTYTNPSVKILHRNIICNKNIRQKNILPRTNINMNKSSNYFIQKSNYNSNNNNNNNQMNKSMNNKSFEKININNNNTPNKLLISNNNYISNKLHLKKIELPNIPITQRSHSPDVNNIKKKTINRGEDIKNVQITHIICSSKNKNPNFHITEKLSTNNIKSTPLTISIEDRQKLKKGGKSTYTSSCQENRPILNQTQNLKGKTTIYQHARGIGMTNDKKLNSNFYTSDIRKFEPIMNNIKTKEKVEHVENFRSTKYRNSNIKRDNNNNEGYKGFNTIENCNRSGIKKIIGNNEIKKEIIIVNNDNIENNSGNIMKEIIN